MHADPELRGLARALDPDQMLPFVGQAVGIAPDDLDGFRCAAELITHKPGQRCVVRYALSGASQQDTRRMIGKVYRSRARATAMYERMEALRGCGVPSIPACLMLVPRMRLVLQECADGVELEGLLDSPEGVEPLARAARWLLELHAAPPLPGLREVPAARSLEKALAWCAEIASRLPAAAEPSRRACGGLELLVDGLPAYTPTMIHRDFHPAHVLWNGKRISIVDFDELSLGDPALDVGHFLAQLASVAERRTGDFRAFADQARRFGAIYRAGAAVDPGPRLPFARAYTFVKLAHQQALHEASGWQRRVAALLALAVDEAGSAR